MGVSPVPLYGIGRGRADRVRGRRACAMPAADARRGRRGTPARSAGGAPSRPRRPAPAPAPVDATRRRPAGPAGPGGPASGALAVRTGRARPRRRGRRARRPLRAPRPCAGRPRRGRRRRRRAGDPRRRARGARGGRLLAPRVPPRGPPAGARVPRLARRAAARTLEGQVADLDRLAGDDARRAPARRPTSPTTGGAVRTRLRLGFSTAGGTGEGPGDTEQALDYRGTPKDLSTVLHVAVARALRGAATPGDRGWRGRGRTRGCGSRRCAPPPSSPSTASSAGPCSSRGAGSTPRSRSPRVTCAAGPGSGRGPGHRRG